MLTDDIRDRIEGNNCNKDKPKMLVQQLKDALVLRGINVAGMKAPELRKSLVENYERMPVAPASAAHWCELMPSGTVPEHEYKNRPEGTYAPTEGELPEGVSQAPKHSFDETFARDDVYEGRKFGGPDPQWLEEKNIDHNSHPIQYADAFWGTEDFKEAGVYMNKRVLIFNIGQEGGEYAGYNPDVGWTADRVAAHVGLEFVNGLLVTPRAADKLDRSSSLLYHPEIDGMMRKWTANPTLDHQVFMRTFTSVDPLAARPDAKLKPLWLVDKVLDKLQARSMAAWEQGQDFSFDEMDCGYQGSSPTGQRVKFKKKGDGMLVDALCQNGYTLSLAFRRVPPPWVPGAYRCEILQGLEIIPPLRIVVKHGVRVLTLP